LGYEPRQPPIVLYHGTARKNLDSILKYGLVRGNRHHVHLSMDKATAFKVGQRHGFPILLIVLADKLYDMGVEFYCSDNGVWLTDYVPPEYIKQ
jgi:putative RNA 2'-phosphotransferase